MSSSLLDRLRRSLSLRLTVWYAIVSICAYAILFALAYQSLSSSLRKEDYENIVSKLKELSRVYHKGGLNDLETHINAERDSGKPVLLFVRVADKDDSTLFLSLPDQWTDADLTALGRLSVQRSEQLLHVRLDGRDAIFEVISTPLPDEHFLQIGRDIQRRQDILARFQQVFLAAMAPAILIGIIGGYFLAARSLRPIRNLTETIRSVISTGAVDARVPTGAAADELNALGVLFNQMLETIERLVQGMKDSLDNVAHDLRTPLTRMRTVAEMAIQSDKGIADCKEALADCLEECERIITMLNIMMDVAEAEAGTLTLFKERTNVAVLIEEAVELYRCVAEDKDISITERVAADMTAALDPHRIRQVLTNLLDNAVKYTPDGGSISVDATKDSKGVTITISDTGPGIPNEEIPRIWERLYRGDKSRSHKGLGLGLSLVKSIVKAHEGAVFVTSVPGRGSSFTICLPLGE